MLELKHISKSFQEREIIKDLSLVFPDTGMIGIQGESGCGKSTLLYIIGMLDDNFEGDIFYNGEKVINHDVFIRQHVSFVMQSNDLIPALNVRENIVLACQVSDLHYTSAQLKKICHQLEISQLISRYPNQLSGGQYQRVSLAKALLKQADIILADEPTGALHSKQAHEVMTQLKKLSEQSLVIVVSHDPNLLKQYCTIILTLHNGQLKGRMKKLSQNPIQSKTQHHHSLLIYPFRQLLYQRNKLLFLFLFQWIVIVAFFIIVTAINGVFDAIDMSEKSAAQFNIMTIEKRDKQIFNDLMNSDMMNDVQYTYHLESLIWSQNNQDISTNVNFLPMQTSHLRLQKGHLPQSVNEVIVSDALYQSLKDKNKITATYQSSVFYMNIVGVLKTDLFDQHDLYCSPLFREKILDLKNPYGLTIEAKEGYRDQLYTQLSQDYLVYSEVKERVDNYQSLLKIAQMIAYVFIGISFFISLLLIGIVESTIYLERQHDVAYLLSLGMGYRRLLFLSIVEAIGLGILMALGGSLLALLVYYYVNEIYDLAGHFFFSLQLHCIWASPYDLYVVIFISYMLMTIIGALLPMKSMMKVNMIDVLREE